jgi:hypothetical protein
LAFEAVHCLIAGERCSTATIFAMAFHGALFFKLLNPGDDHIAATYRWPDIPCLAKGDLDLIWRDGPRRMGRAL